MTMGTTINIKVDEETKKEAQRIADELGFSLSAILKGYLRQFVRTKEVNVRLEEPSDYLIESIKESNEDIRAGRAVSFESPYDALRHADQLVLADEEKDTKD